MRLHRTRLVARLQSVRYWIQIAALSGLVLIAYSNFRAFEETVYSWPPDTDDISVLEERYRGIRKALIEAKYTRGPIVFVTRRDLVPSEKAKPGEKANESDFARWAQGQ